MIIYFVYSGEYPFTDYLGTVVAPADNPEQALKIAIGFYGGHPVVEPAE